MTWDDFWQLLTHWMTGSKPAAVGARLFLLVLVLWWIWRLDRKVTALSVKLGMRLHPLLGHDVATAKPDSR